MEHTLSYFSTVLYKSFLAYTTGQLQTMGLSSGCLPFILYVGKHPGCTPTALTQALAMDWGHSQRSITRLVRGGFLSSEKQGRVHRLTLTASGEEAFSLSHGVFHSWDDQIMAGLGADERRQLFSLLEKLLSQCGGTDHVRNR